MPKLPVFTSKKLLKVLKENGFDVDHITGSHYVLYNEITNKIVTVPFHNKDLPKGTLLSILKSSGLNRNDL